MRRSGTLDHARGQVGPVHLLELFHGPTLAFKDVALQFLGNLFEYVLGETGGEMNIVAATSGDTGSAAIYGMRGRERIRIFVMHPHGRVSPVQERQMTTVLDDNVCNLAVEGTFDDCQNIVKDLFNDLQFRDACRLGAVNSINWAACWARLSISMPHSVCKIPLAQRKCVLCRPETLVTFRLYGSLHGLAH